MEVIVTNVHRNAASEILATSNEANLLEIIATLIAKAEKAEKES